jgi:hypothetical protein
VSDGAGNLGMKMLSAVELIDRALKTLRDERDAARSTSAALSRQTLRLIDARDKMDRRLLSLGFVIDSLETTAALRDNGESVVIKLDRQTYDELIALKDIVPDPPFDKA